MINSRDPAELHPTVRAMYERHMQACKDHGLDVLLISTYRDAESQAALYAQGRTKPGRVVTFAKPGQSMHNWRCAYDVVPLRLGKLVWGTTGTDLDLWKSVGALGESVGLEWAGRWRGSLVEFGHFQWTGGLTIADLQAGKQLPLEA